MIQVSFVAPQIDLFVVLVGASSLSVAALVLGVVPSEFRLWYLGHVVRGLVPMPQLVPVPTSSVRRQANRMQYCGSKSGPRALPLSFSLILLPLVQVLEPSLLLGELCSRVLFQNKRKAYTISSACVTESLKAGVPNCTTNHQAFTIGNSILKKLTNSKLPK